MTARSHRLPYRFILSMHSVLPFPGLAFTLRKAVPPRSCWHVSAIARASNLRNWMIGHLQDIGIFGLMPLHELRSHSGGIMNERLVLFVVVMTITLAPII